MKCGLLGEKLTHSYSPQIHNLIADYPYNLFEASSDELPAFFANTDFTGINVTIPYKKSVLTYCDSLSDCAKRLGSVNTIVRLDDGSLYGHNTDYYGFLYLIRHMHLQISQKKVLVLGSGGASVSVCAVLEDLGAKVIIISRSGENNYNNISKHSDAALIVNTTPVGMYPDNGQSPVDLSILVNLEGVIDIIYNPTRTKLLLDAEARGITVESGLRMLVAQAVESAKFFTKREFSESIIEKIYNMLTVQMNNIILIGMPGCGKSTIGKLLAQCLNREFVDADAYLSETYDVSIPELINQRGVPAFRKLETQTLQELGKRSGIIISTGGGCVTVPENFNHLRQNGHIIWLKRELDKLPTDGRPISQQTSLQELYDSRASLYQHFADTIIDNNGAPSATVEKIIQEVFI